MSHSKPHEQKQAITEVQLDAIIAPWLGEYGERLPPVDVLVNNGSGVLVLDCRTKAAKDIEHQMAGYETKEKQQGIVSEVARQANALCRCSAQRARSQANARNE